MLVLAERGAVQLQQVRPGAAGHLGGQLLEVRVVGAVLGGHGDVRVPLHEQVVAVNGAYLTDVGVVEEVKELCDQVQVRTVSQGEIFKHAEIDRGERRRL